MRTILFLSAAGFLCVPGSVSAQSLQEFVSCEYRVLANFPGEPVQQDITYQAGADVAVPARVFVVENDIGRFVMTAVDFTASDTNMREAVSQASETLKREGETLFEAHEELEGIPGRQLSIAAGNGGRILANVFEYGRRLYILEGHAPPGRPPAGQIAQFVQSVMMLDERGWKIAPGRPENAYHAADC